MIPNLSRAQLERLSLLLEELGETQQAIGKVLRHGFESKHPRRPRGLSNREMLAVECGDILAALDLLVSANDLDDDLIGRSRMKKHKTVRQYLHHQPSDP